MTTYDNATYTPANFDGVLAHEIGHEFGALDEYAAPAGYPSSGSLFSGYLWVKNANATQGGTSHDVCIMRGGEEGLRAYQGAATYGGDVSVDGGICPSTRGQIGWRVTRNGLPDVVDTTPTVTLAKPVLDGSGATVSGVAAEHPWTPGHNAKGRAFAKGISIFVPHDLQYSVDGGAWTAVSPTGSGARQSFSFATGALAPAAAPATTRHVIAVQATTGTTATSTVIAWTNPTPVVLNLASNAAAIAFGGKVKLTVHAADADAPAYAIGFLPGVVVGPQAGAAATQHAVTTAAGGSAVVTVAPRFTTTFAAALPSPKAVQGVDGDDPRDRHRGRARPACGARRRVVCHWRRARDRQFSAAARRRAARLAAAQRRRMADRRQRAYDGGFDLQSGLLREQRHRGAPCALRRRRRQRRRYADAAGDRRTLTRRPGTGRPSRP